MGMYTIDLARNEAYHVANYVRVVALAEHADLLLDIFDIVSSAQRYHLDRNNFSRCLDTGFIDQSI